MAKHSKVIGGLIRVHIDGYTGKGPDLVGFEITATGIIVTLRGPLAFALQISDTHNTSDIKATIR